MAIVLNSNYMAKVACPIEEASKKVADASKGKVIEVAIEEGTCEKCPLGKRNRVCRGWCNAPLLVGRRRSG